MGIRSGAYFYNPRGLAAGIISVVMVEISPYYTMLYNYQ